MGQEVLAEPTVSVPASCAESENSKFKQRLERILFSTRCNKNTVNFYIKIIITIKDTFLLILLKIFFPTLNTLSPLFVALSEAAL